MIFTNSKLYRKLSQVKQWLHYNYLIRFDSTVISQRKNPLEIPVIIINFNQLIYLRQLVSFLQKRKFSNIVIIDNKSDYGPLLEYYKSLKGVTLELMDKNYGHMVFFENKELREKWGKGYFIITDADIVPNPKTPSDFMNVFIKELGRNVNGVTKVGFALRIDNIPDYYPLKTQVIEWEQQHWVAPQGNEKFKAQIDTTFALYKPGYPSFFENVFFL